MKLLRHSSRAFTLVELLAVIAIVAILIGLVIPWVMSYVSIARQRADQQTLVVLNDALTRYKTQGGSVSALTTGTPIRHVFNLLKTPVTWSGQSHQFLQSAFTRPARSLSALGTGAQYHFSAFNSYIAESGGSSPTGLNRIYLTTTGAGTWTVPINWNSSNNVIECIGGGGNGGCVSGNLSGGGGGAYSAITNLSLTPGNSISYQVGAAASDTWFNGATLGASSVGAKGGANAVSANWASGGAAASGVGSVKYSGGRGGMSQYGGSAGGGGAGGPHGNGGDGGKNGASNYVGGGGGGAGGGGNAADVTVNKWGGNNYLGTGGGTSTGAAGTNGGGGAGGQNTPTNISGGAGGNGTEWGSYGAGGGGGGTGGVNQGPSLIGGNGGLYGGGGGGGYQTSGVGAVGAQGIIVISYTVP